MVQDGNLDQFGNHWFRCLTTTNIPGGDTDVSFRLRWRIIVSMMGMMAERYFLSVRNKFESQINEDEFQIYEITKQSPISRWLKIYLEKGTQESWSGCGVGQHPAVRS